MGRAIRQQSDAHEAEEKATANHQIRELFRPSAEEQEATTSGTHAQF
jgi:hypothetical protein